MDTGGARTRATAWIALQARKFPELSPGGLDASGLPPRDAALALAIERAVTGRWLTLIFVLQPCLTRPWDGLEARLQAVLLCGAAQLLLLDRVPDHAAINEAVEWAKRHVRAKAGGLVNAALRKLVALRGEHGSASSDSLAGSFGRDELPLADGRAWKLRSAVFDEHSIGRLAQQTSHPDALISQWMSAFGQPATARLALHNIVHAPIIVHGAAGAAATALLCPHDLPGFHVFTGEHHQLLELLQSRSDLIVQDPASASPVEATRPSSASDAPATIIDACAGRGTKTRQLAAMHSRARIIATDVNDDRLATLRQQFARSTHVEVVHHAALGQFAGQADLLVLDVPCSNTGVLARRLEARYRLSRTRIDELVALQRQIVADHLALLGQRGRLLYCTCSLESAENQQQAQWIAKWHPLEVVDSKSMMPAGGPGDPPTAYHDGGYFALLRKM